MDVSEILKLLATLSIGLDDPTESDIVVFMQYINLCYFEILQDTISQNPLVEIIDFKSDCTDGILEEFNVPLFIPKAIYDIATNCPLRGTTFDAVVKIDPAISKTGTPQEWYYSGGRINVYPLATSTVADGGGYGVKYIPQPVLLSKTTPSENILIPPLFQQVLADGASYYLFQSESGFKDQLKMQSAMARWQTGKLRLFAYMKNISGKNHFSTYSPV